MAKHIDEKKRQAKLKNCLPSTNLINEINNVQTENVKDIDDVIPMHNLIKSSDNYSKPFGSLWQYFTCGPSDNTRDS